MRLCVVLMCVLSAVATVIGDKGVDNQHAEQLRCDVDQDAPAKEKSRLAEDTSTLPQKAAWKAVCSTRFCEFNSSASSSKGCGRAFMEGLPRTFLASGTHWDELESAQHLFHHRSCADLGGCFVNLQFDIMRYLGKLGDGDGSTPQAVLARRLRRFYTAWVTPVEVADALSGIAFCIPLACLHISEAEVAPLVRLYVVWMASRGSLSGAESLSDMLSSEDFNISLPCGKQSDDLLENSGTAESRISSRGEPSPALRVAKGAAHAEEATAEINVASEHVHETTADKAKPPKPYDCKNIWRARSSLLTASSGAQAYLGNDMEMDTFYVQQRTCNFVHGERYHVARFDLHKYINEYVGAPGTNESEPMNVDTQSNSTVSTATEGRLASVAALGKLSNARHNLKSTLLATWRRHGVGLCVPEICSQEPTELSRIALEYFASALGLSEELRRHLPLVMQPTHGSTADSFPDEHQVLQLDPLMVGLRPPGRLGSWQHWNRNGASKSSEERNLITALQGRQSSCVDVKTGPNCTALYLSIDGACRCLPGPNITELDGEHASINISSWADCRDADFPAEWHQLRAAVAAAPGDPFLDPTVVSLSDAIVRRYEWRALDWLARVWQMFPTCSMDYIVVTEDPLPSGSFMPVALLFLDPTDMRWSRWRSWRTFCAMGYTAALFYRARALDLLGLTSDASGHLEQAMRTLGACREFDFLERAVWRVDSLDIETNLLRIRDAATRKDIDENGGRLPPTFAHSERPSTWTQFASFREAFPAKARVANALVWSALKQNALYRRFFNDVVQDCKADHGGDNSPPALALFAWPPVFAVFIYPQIVRLWPTPTLAFFFLGSWHVQWEKCPECKEELAQHVVLEQRLLLESVPLRRSVLHETQLGMEIDWGNAETGNFTSMDLVVVLREVFLLSRAFRDAEVFVCSAHLWFCLLARLVNQKPMMIVDLANPNQGLALDIREKWYANTASGVLQLQSPGPWTTLIRDELLRAVLPAKGCTNSMNAEDARGEVECYDGSWEMADFIPFVAFPSLYIRQRWTLPSAFAASTSMTPTLKGPFLVAREGSAGKFSKTMRGQHFFTMFKHMAQSLFLNMTFMIWEYKRLPFKDMVQQYRGAVAFPGITGAKRTPHDFYIMEMPLFFPSKRLSAAALGSTGYYAAVPCDDGPWRHMLPLRRLAVPPLCGWLRTAFQLELSSFYRLPHLFYFEGVADLARKLGAVTDDDLQRTSAGMRRFSHHRIEDDLQIWHNIIIASVCSATGSANGGTVSRKLPLPVHANGSDPSCLFGMLSVEGYACCTLECGTCEDTNCRDLPPGEERCCPATIRAINVSCFEAPAPCSIALDGAATGTLSAFTCEESPAYCSHEVLQYATHIDENMSELVL